MQLASIEPELATPFEQLLDIERRSALHELSEGRSKAAGAIWSGLGFVVGDFHLLVTLEDVAEVVKVPRLTRVPGAKPWVKGIANLRGTVITAVEFTGFLGLEKRRSTLQRRLLVFSAEGWTSALIVDEIYGMRAFYDGDQTAHCETLTTSLKSYVAEAYRSDDVVWHVFKPSRLLNDSAFLTTAV
jgi:twitching motility protein PilI